jgi:hypothetical protein
MGKFVFERNFKAHFVPAIAAIAAPTVAEIAAGTEITPWLPVDGWQPSRTNNKSSTAMMDNAYVSQRMGTFQDDLELTFTRDDASSTVWDLFDHGTAGFVVVAPFKDEDGDTAADRVEVWPVESSKPAPQASGENEDQKF